MLNGLHRAARRFSRPPASAEAEVAVTCRVRLARNLAGHRFPDWAGDAEREAIRKRLEPAVLGTPAFRGGTAYAVDRLDELALQELVERRLISHDLADGGAGAGVALSRDGSLSVMFNEEDHLRIQAILPGMDLERAWRMADEADTQIERKVRYAFDETLGYLTACPSNLGTGLRASVMLHLPGLRLAGDLDAVYRAFDALRVEVRGMGGEGSEAAGNLVQVSNQGTLGEDEPHVVAGLLHIVRETVRQERFARRRLLRAYRETAVDYVARSLALLQGARLMGGDEALDCLSALRLGLEWGLLSGVDRKAVAELADGVQPGHLRRMLGGGAADPAERDIARAKWLRDRLARARVRH